MTSIDSKICKLLSLILFAHAVFPAALNSVKNPNPKLIVLSYDGFRADYMDRVSTPTLEKLINEGVKVPYMRSQFPTKTFPNHQSIITGLNTESHGITDNTVFDPKYNRTLTGFQASNPEFWKFNDEILPIWVISIFYMDLLVKILVF